MNEVNKVAKVNQDKEHHNVCTGKHETIEIKTYIKERASLLKPYVKSRLHLFIY